jgi:hypothetical protein
MHITRPYLHIMMLRKLNWFKTYTGDKIIDCEVICLLCGLGINQITLKYNSY